MARGCGVLVVATALAVATASGLGCGGESLGGGAPAGTGGSSATFGTGTGGAVVIPSACGEMQSVSVAAPVPPDILILMDRSSSLLDDASGISCPGGCGASSKWALLTAAIDNLVVARASVNWGLMFFGTDDACGTTPGPAVPVSGSPGSAMSVVGALGATTPGGDAPTAAALSAAAEYLGGLSDGGPKYVLLVTDGRSGCSEPATADVSAENQVATLGSLGFPTFVLAAVAPSDTTAIAALNQMAVNGEEQLEGGANAFYSTTDDLGAQLEPLTSTLASCTIPLAWTLTSEVMLAISVELRDGSELLLPHDSTNGWELVGPSYTSVSLNGTSCESSNDGGYRQIYITYQCDVPEGLGHSRAQGR